MRRLDLQASARASKLAANAQLGLQAAGLCGSPHKASVTAHRAAPAARLMIINLRPIICGSMAEGELGRAQRSLSYARAAQHRLSGPAHVRQRSMARQQEGTARMSQPRDADRGALHCLQTGPPLTCR